MPAEAATWHYIIAEVIFFILGVTGHVVRAVFNLYPDRLSDKPMMDLVISDGFNLGDYLLGTEYDDNGFYRLDSIKNLRISVSTTMVGGFAMMLLAPGASGAIAGLIDQGLVFIKDLFFLRLEQAGIL